MRLTKILKQYMPEWFIFMHAYHSLRGKWPNYINPKDISEIWIQKYLSGYFHKYYYLADKYEVRKYVESKGCKDILVPLVGVWDSVKDINWKEVPEEFALKLNYGAGMNIICTDKNTLNIQKVESQLDRWINAPKSANFETHYNLINRKIICEEFIKDNNGIFPYDYKFICIHGEPICILTCTNRESGTPSDAVFTLDWKLLPHFRKATSPNIKSPMNLDKMLKYARILAEGLDLVRIDFYDTEDKIYFGEMTLTPAGCLFHAWTQEALDELGEIYRNKKKSL